MVASVENLHGALVAIGDESDQRLVRRLADRCAHMLRCNIAQDVFGLHDDPLLTSP
jgi:hypothetical protein